MVNEVQENNQVWARPPIGKPCLITFVDQRSAHSIARKLNSSKEQLVDAKWVANELLIRSVTILAVWDGEFHDDKLVLKDFGSVSGTNLARQQQDVINIMEKGEEAAYTTKMLRQGAIEKINLV